VLVHAIHKVKNLYLMNGVKQHVRMHSLMLTNRQEATRVEHLSAAPLFGRLLESRGRIFSCMLPFYECAVSDLDMPMHRSLLV